jgi:hypothetical protein
LSAADRIVKSPDDIKIANFMNMHD